MELFEAIRREYEHGVGTVQGVARKFGVHRRLVREALGSAVPVPKPAKPRARPRIAAVAADIEAILEADRHAPRKQRHTAHRIYTRLRAERPEAVIAEPTVRRYVRERKQALGLLGRETYVPQSHPWGVEGQMDWYEAVGEVDGARVTAQVFVLRSMASAGAYHRAYPRATQQAFLEAHELAFEYFGGVFRRVRYDNLPQALKRIVRGSRRDETSRFVGFRSHWGFESEFCTPGEAHEKGGVENEVGTFRRNHWVPVPAARDWAELNAHLLAACRADEARVLDGRTVSVGAAQAIEREHLLPLPAERCDLVETQFATVTKLGCVKVRTNAYSVPVPAGRQVQVSLSPTTVAVWYEGRCVAEHERSYGRGQEVLDLEHYLDVLAHKPGALAGSKPLAQWRQLGRWPASYDALWDALIARQGRSAGTKALIELLQLGRQHGQAALRQAIETALTLGCTDPAAVRHLVTAAQGPRPAAPVLDIGALARYERPLPAVDAYDQLLTAGSAR